MLLTRILLHLTLAWTNKWEGPSRGSWRKIADVRIWEAVRRESCEVSRPLKMTKLPSGIYLVADTLMLA